MGDYFAEAVWYTLVNFGTIWEEFGEQLGTHLEQFGNNMEHFGTIWEQVGTI